MAEYAVFNIGIKTFRRRHGFRICFVFFFLIVLISGCTTIKGDIGKPQFIQENLPVRNLRICLIADKGIPPEKAEALVSEVSSDMEEQVGITLTTTVRLTNSVMWASRERGEMLGHAYRVSKPYVSEFDVCVCIAEPTVSEKIKSGLAGDWNGLIDDIFRRYIIVKNMNSGTLLHEMYHAFIFSHQHSGSGIMQSTLISIFPFVPLYLNSDKYLSPSDRKEVLENKWRNFNSPVNVKNALEKIINENP